MKGLYSAISAAEMGIIVFTAGMYEADLITASSFILCFAFQVAVLVNCLWRAGLFENEKP